MYMGNGKEFLGFLAKGFCGVFGQRFLLGFWNINFYNMNLNDLLSVCCITTGQDIERVKKKDRYRELVFTRHLFFYMARYYFGAKLNEIQTIFRCDHSTVLHGVNVVKDLLSINDLMATKAVDAIKETIGRNNKFEKQLTVFVPFEVKAAELAEMLINKYGCRVITANA